MFDESHDLLIAVTRRLFLALATLFSVALATMAFSPSSPFVVPAVVIMAGAIGGFVGLQRRLKELTIPDLRLIASSWIYTSLSPLVGGVLGLLLYVIFLSGLLSGDLFPHFLPDDSAKTITSFSAISQQHADGYKEYAKLIFWCFMAGFSERFVTDVISRFEGAAIKTLPQIQAGQDAQPHSQPDLAHKAAQGQLP